MDNKKDIFEIYSEDARNLLKESPEQFLKKIKYTAYKSYAYFLGIFLCSVTALIASLLAYQYLRTVSIYIAIITGTMAYTVFQGIFYDNTDDFEEPYQLVPEQYPKLFLVLRDLEQKFDLKIHKVYLDESFNAGVIQKARFGIFGGYQNVLIIGLQYILFVSPDELLPTLAHEFAHLSHNDSRSTGIAYSIRNTWIQMIMIVHRLNRSLLRRIGTSPITWHINRVWPKLNAYTYVYLQAAEYKADEVSVKISGLQKWAENIAKIHAGDFYKQTFWEHIIKNIRDSKEIPKDVYTQFIDFLKQPVNIIDLKQWINQAAFISTKSDDTHPVLEDRLRAQNIEPTDETLFNLALRRENVSAAEFYFENNYQKIIKYYNNKYYSNLKENWDKYLKYIENFDAQIKDISLDKLLETESRWEMLDALVQKNGLKSIEKTVQQLLEKIPDDSASQYYKACLLLDNSQKEGEEMMFRLMKEKKVAPERVYKPLHIFYSRNNLRDEAKKLENNIKEYKEALKETFIELNTLNDKKDRLVKHDLPNEVIEKIHELLKNRWRVVSKVYIARKILTNDPEKKLYIVGIKKKRLYFGFHENSDDILNDFQTVLQIPAIYFIIESSETLYQELLKSTPDSLVYSA